MGNVRIFKTRSFVRFARRERISDETLVDAVARAERGLIDADLGSGLIKQRVARPGRGRSGGYRVLIAYRRRRVAVFMFGFAKSETENITPGELEGFRDAAALWTVTDTPGWAILLEDGSLQEIILDEET